MLLFRVGEQKESAHIICKKNIVVSRLETFSEQLVAVRNVHKNGCKE
jgi:hypothetical protein